ncbi:ankyrin repeat-containing domain protein [Mycena rebaudengoi]|nr:ankyrin repeat-containing domain protein [Mycena rebaudengoi]
MSDRRRDCFKDALGAVFSSHPSSPSSPPSSTTDPSAIAGTPVIIPEATSVGTTLSEAPSVLNSVAISPSESVPGNVTPNSKDLVVDQLSLAVDAAEKLAGLVTNVPFIAPVAGLLSQIVTVYKEIKDVDDKRDSLLGRITSITQDLCATILRMEAANHVDLLGRLKPDVEKYTSLLGEASKFIVDYGGLGSIRRGLARNQLGGKFVELQQKLDLFGTRFRTNRLVDLVVQQNTMKGTLEDVHVMAVADKLERWLRFPPDMQQKQHDTQKLRKELDTGRWFLECPAFIQWQDNPGSLWIQGDSGTGKSVLSSTIIHKLIDDQQLFKELRKLSAVSFLYFDFKTKEEQLEIALRRLVFQLSAQYPYPYRTLDKHHDLSKGQTLPNYEDLVRIVEDILPEIGRTYIVLDALDECGVSELEQLLGLVSNLQGWTRSPLHLLITSQPRTSFTDRFRDIPRVFLERGVTQKDIELFVAGELRKMKTWAKRADDIIPRIVSKSNGMFRLAACLLVELSRCKRQNELETKLENLPNDLFGIYDRFLQSIRPEDMVSVTGVLRLLMFSKDLPDVTELADAVAFDFSDSGHFTYDQSLREDHANAIPEWFEGLYHSRESAGNAEATRTGPRIGHSHTFIAQTCTGYLLHFADHPLDSETYPTYPFARYAAEHWSHHLLRCHDQAALVSEAMKLLEDESNQYIALNNLRHSYSDFRPFDFPKISPLYLSAEDGYLDGVRGLLQKGADVNLLAEEGTALYAATAKGHTEIVIVLLQNGADVNAMGGRYGTALQVACARSHLECVSILLENGADISIQGGKYGTALQAACFAGCAPIVELLLEHGADVNTRCGEYGTALQAAAVQTEIVSLLLRHGADVHAEGGRDGSAFLAASTRGHIKTLSLLLENGVDINAEVGGFGTALDAAAGSYYEHDRRADTVQFLLAHGADINAQGGRYGSALYAASMFDRPEVVRVLLRNGAEVNSNCGGRGTALSVASQNSKTMTLLLLDNGAGVNADDEKYGSALQSAATFGHRLLLDYGAEINARGGKYGCALKAASSNGHTDTANLLRGRGAAEIDA